MPQLPIRYKVSIHAPTWGATASSREERRQRPSFNPRPHMGGDLDNWLHPFIKDSVSIHAPTWGATVCIRLLFGGQRFQSTPPHGGRPCSIEHMAVLSEFQSTPPHGGRLRITGNGGDRPAFQSTPPHGGRLQQHHATAKPPCFNPRPHMGGDLSRGSQPTAVLQFQSTPPHGGRR